MKYIIACVLVVISGVYGQTVTPPQGYPFSVPAPPTVSSVSASRTGTAQGDQTYYYWVIANYPNGAVMPNTYATIGQLPPLSGTNYVTVSWVGTGATNYTVVRTTTPSGLSGTCTGCVVAANTTSLSAVNDNTSLTDLSISTYALPASASLSLYNFAALPYIKVTTGISAAEATVTAPFFLASVEPSVCMSAIRQMYFNTSTNILKVCNVDNIWTQISASGGVMYAQWPAAKCQVSAPVAGLNLPTSNYPAAACDTDGKPVLTFSATTQVTSAESSILPDTLTALSMTIPVRASASSSNTSGAVTGTVSYTCVAVDGTGTSVPTLSSTATATATWTSEAGNLAKPLAFTLSTTGCAGKRLYWSVGMTTLTTFTSIQAINTIVLKATP